MKAAAIPLTTKNGRYYLRKTFEGKQEIVALGKDLKTARSRAARFLATAETSGFLTAKSELTGKKCIKAGANPTFEEMEILYRAFCAQSANPPRSQTIDHNLARLNCIMKRAGFATVGKINKHALSRAWFKDTTPTPAQKRTFASAISAASGVFKSAALEYYKSRKVPVENPFKGLEVPKAKVSPYVPISQEIREAIWTDCQTELAPNEAMIVLMALGIGMRRAEIEAAIPSWFSKQSDKVLVNIKEEEHFEVKNGEDGVVPIPLHLYETLLKLRGDSDSFYFVPCESPKTTAGRIWERVRVVNAWLKSKGLNDRKPLHALRKEMGSHVAKNQGILEASKILRNTPQVCAIHYAGISEVNTVDIGGSFKAHKTPEEAFAESLGVTVEELRTRLAESQLSAQT